MRTAEATGFPSLTDLNRLPSRDFADAIALLFEPAPRFAAWLAGARPFKSDGMMLEAAARIAHRMTETEQVELINAHPRLGARDRLSDASGREQGAKQDRVDAKLGRLNDAYEARFGFRYLVYVAGRPREELLPEFRAALRGDREAELRRALDDTLAIAADRLRWFRSPTLEDA
ncbi:MAG: 2-oxo-4-hydroxy-4-carboxy-5-ureidoimidazoline decarboxylase [Chloroflexota bacterium]